MITNFYLAGSRHLLWLKDVLPATRITVYREGTRFAQVATNSEFPTLNRLTRRITVNIKVGLFLLVLRRAASCQNYMKRLVCIESMYKVNYQVIVVARTFSHLQSAEDPTNFHTMVYHGIVELIAFQIQEKSCHYFHLSSQPST